MRALFKCICMQRKANFYEYAFSLFLRSSIFCNVDAIFIFCVLEFLTAFVFLVRLRRQYPILTRSAYTIQL